ncbi:unnamed protein product [Pleuronectes platessa]|uniref:Uncharacterized protein n=1 Tax=Pleuronectes platessa TaxID=8262 RepID=A0A9N7VWI8_PLEPL|nr:unnamed protein product [Pleuronectes platessa]
MSSQGHSSLPTHYALAGSRVNPTLRARFAVVAHLAPRNSHVQTLHSYIVIGPETRLCLASRYLLPTLLSKPTVLIVTGRRIFSSTPRTKQPESKPNDLPCPGLPTSGPPRVNAFESDFAFLHRADKSIWKTY